MDFRISFEEELEAVTPGGGDLVINAQLPPIPFGFIVCDIAFIHQPVERGVHCALRQLEAAAAFLFDGLGDFVAVAVALAEAGKDEGFNEGLQEVGFGFLLFFFL
ncbi:MAG: hypothetical protein KIC46_10035 [Clostridiales bacterium]|nr:hypothetical protein [Clostridiales bacterium]